MFGFGFGLCRRREGGGAIGPVVDVWILLTGLWNDAGVWSDTDTWNDGA